ncbi:unnamed protein product [Peronospora belbahrii]|uniref:Uncharacterized protein n=1 Tax=Peronospora belbahrii TaxID=622444 RepID=A0AAU9L2W2_9STRA|nr:unnamed protein product [Peronospora belbahrii]CAH0520695.1 unnamed protein product [Peronospora belbahrii]
MTSPSSPILHSIDLLKTPNTVTHISSKLRRNSLVNDHEDIMLLREKLTRIAVGRRQDDDEEVIDEEKEETEERRRIESSGALAHFKVFSLLPLERPNTPPSSPQPRDVLRKQLKLKQPTTRSRKERVECGVKNEDTEFDAMVSVEEVAIMPMENVETDNAIYSPPLEGHKRSSRARFLIPGHLKSLPSINILNKRPEGWRKRKCVHVAAAEDGHEEARLSLKKTSSQISILTDSKGTLSRSSSGGGLFQTFAARQRHEKDQEMENVGCTTQPQSPENALFGNKHGQLSACS